MNKLIKAAVASVVLGAVGSAMAATDTTTFTVTATVVASCDVSADPALAFPDFTPGGTDQVASANISVTCTNGHPYSVGLNQGLYGASTAARLMQTGGGAQLSYALFTDAGYTTNWDNIGGTNTVAGTGDGPSTPDVIPVYGRILAASNAAATPGNYSDTITVTVNY
jgi:spore coat protein U-like protein